MVFFHIDLDLFLFFSVFHVVCRRPVAAYFVSNLLRRVVVLPMVFTLTIQMTKFDST